MANDPPTGDEEVESPAIIEEHWNLPLDFHLFASHQTHRIRLTAQQFFELECVESLTPLDMMHLSNGIHDATGHCVWMGAFLLIASIAADHLQEHFQGKRVVELGAGTGIAGLCLLLSDDSVAPLCVTFTDADLDALALCQRNCSSNLGKKKKGNDNREPTSAAAERLLYQVQELTWGKPLPLSVSENCYDTVLATDVLYDIGLLSPLLTTASECLRASPGGSFVLSHVPRACFDTEHPPVASLEEYIVQQATGFGFQLESILRPNDLLSPESATAVKMKDALNDDVSVQDLHEAGAAILIFRKKPFSV